ncbi:DUF58 domain-containing protein [Parahaliea sp. F7430]|uniref:DUF58 domain-containing protein n=1 Tax=Sediminihaliea albiluteola TaxID=2758564 RepID=A0A7W2TU70_9GAMM|nr:DUF58 domain-containing protein [Sediminihaliea albiluteola]MBA6411986.1 DUF58 domain-containing protein [Sediminihaliea albiluteola]
MPANKMQQPATGAYVDLATLIAQRFYAVQLQLWRRKRALSALAGPNKSNFRGRGIDFEEVRAYQPGDDIRSIDWRVTARTGDAHTKLFREERERPVLIAIDQRNSQFFGSQHCFKSVLAAHIASLIAWSALANGDRVGALVFNEQQHREIRPRRSRKTVLAILSEIAHYNQLLPLKNIHSANSFSDMLSQLRHVARPGSSIYLISDFQGANETRAQKHLYQLAQHTEITAFACSDPLERELPQAGLYAVTDGQRRTQLNTADKTLRKNYAQSARIRADNLTASMQRLGIPLLELSTSDSPFAVLQRYYGAEGR